MPVAQMEPVAQEFHTFEQAIAVAKALPELREEVIPIREFRYKEDADRNVTLEKEGTKFLVDLDCDHARKQLCGLIKYPATVFQVNEASLNVTIMKERLPMVPAAQHLVKWVEDDEGRHLRAILPHTYASIKDVEMLDLAKQTLPRDFKVNKMHFGETTSVCRFVSERDKFNIDGREVSLGMNLTCSEVGGSKLILDSMIYVPVCTNGAIVTWGRERYHSHNYRDLQAQDLRDIYTNLITRFTTERDRIKNILQEAAAKKMTRAQVTDVWKTFTTHRLSSKKFMEEITGELEMQTDGTALSHWDLVNYVTQKAHERLPSDQRIRHEIFAGQALGLDMPVNEAAAQNN